jgi:flagellar protein FlaI
MEKVEEYQVNIGDVAVKISILGGKGQTNVYHVDLPQIAPATKALLENIKRGLIREVVVSTTEILDPKSVVTMKKKFGERAEQLLKARIPSIHPDTSRLLISVLMQEMLGLGDIEYLTADEALEEIVITSSGEPVRVYHKRYGWLETNIKMTNEEQILNYANIIGRRVGRQITTLNPLLDAHLLTGDRANAVLFPVSSKGHTITIRKFARDPWTLTDLITNKTCTARVFALIWLAMQYEMNVLISGGTASGKTSFLNVLMPFIPPNHRIVSIEDTRELQLPKFLYWCPLTVRQPNPEGKGEVSMLDLLINSLRMRPDRIILGEMRKKDQAEVLFEAMHTGHSVYATVHADSIAETINRLVNPPIEVPKNMLMGVNLNVVMFRDRRKGIRRVFQMGEFIPAADDTGSGIRPNIIYRWRPSEDDIVEHSSSLRLFEELSRHTGMSLPQIETDLKRKQAILEWMAKNKIRHVDNVGEIMRQYYLDPNAVLEMSGEKLTAS